MKIVLDHGIICSILEKMGGYQNISGIVSFTEISKHLNKKEINLIRKFLELDPRRFGFRGEFFGINGSPANLVPIMGQKYKVKGNEKIIKTQYLPTPIWLAYWKMNEAFCGETGRKLLINSGYRSPACQVLTFFHYLKLHEFDFAKTMAGVALPGYSEHGNPENQAIDFMTVDGIPSDKTPNGFEKTNEFRWLTKHGRKFGFVMSYPPNNNYGIKFEPWHWRYEK